MESLTLDEIAILADVPVSDVRNALTQGLLLSPSIINVKAYLELIHKVRYEQAYKKELRLCGIYVDKLVKSDSHCTGLVSSKSNARTVVEQQLRNYYEV